MSACAAVFGKCTLEYLRGMQFLNSGTRPSVKVMIVNDVEQSSLVSSGILPGWGCQYPSGYSMHFVKMHFVNDLRKSFDYQPGISLLKRDCSVALIKKL